MGTPPAIMGGGLFTNPTQYIKTADPAAYHNAVIESLKAAGEQPADGLKMTANITPNAISIEGTPLTSYGLTVTMDPNAMQGMGGLPIDPSMITQVIFGPTGGPNGYLAQLEGGVVQTMTQGPDMTRRALAAAKGTNTLAANERVKRVSDSLQKDRIAELYISVDEILNTVGPTLMMFGALPDFKPMNPSDPIALSLSADAAGFSGRVYLPNATFKTITDMIPQAPAGGRNFNEGFDF
jgi:hypothetical protein